MTVIAIEHNYVPTEDLPGDIRSNPIPVDDGFFARQTGADNAPAGAGRSHERLKGTETDDLLIGGGGHDLLEGKEGNDVIWTGSAAGHKDIPTQSAGMSVEEIASTGFDVAFGGAGQDRIWGDGDVDWLYGGEGADSVIGGRGDDVLFGNAGHDHLMGSRGNDRINGDGGADRLKGGHGADTLDGDSGRDTLLGGSQADDLQGGGGRDVLKGGRGRDDLAGGIGNDKLVGGAGNDQLTGGVGADKFIFAAGGGQDVITDFEVGTDRISLTRYDLADGFDSLQFTDLPGGLQVAVGTDSIILENLGSTDLSASDFIF